MKQLVISLLIVLGSWASTPANAALISYQFTGTIDGLVESINPSVGSDSHAFNVGQQLLGRYTFDSAAPMQPLPPPGSLLLPAGIYNGAVKALDFSLGAYSSGLQATNLNTLQVYSGGFSQYSLLHLLTGQNTTGVAPYFLRLDLIDSTGNAFSDIDLPGAQPPSISSFDSRRWSLVFLDGSSVLGALDTLQPVPLPSTGVLFVGALIGLALWRMRSSGAFSS